MDLNLPSNCSRQKKKTIKKTFLLMQRFQPSSPPSPLSWTKTASMSWTFRHNGSVREAPTGSGTSTWRSWASPTPPSTKVTPSRLGTRSGWSPPSPNPRTSGGLSHTPASGLSQVGRHWGFLFDWHFFFWTMQWCMSCNRWWFLITSCLDDQLMWLYCLSFYNSVFLPFNCNTLEMVHMNWGENIVLNDV